MPLDKFLAYYHLPNDEGLLQDLVENVFLALLDPNGLYDVGFDYLYEDNQ